MNLTQLLNTRPLQPHKYYFKEIFPLCSKNGLENRRSSSKKTSCVEELQSLFACLKKWEFDNLPCEKFHGEFMRCIEAERKAEERLKQEDVTLGSDNKNISVKQFNKLMKMYPQPDLGQQPYRVMRRLPTQAYADDIFNRKKIKGKPS